MLKIFRVLTCNQIQSQNNLNNVIDILRKIEYN
jgi:hypothetical protein